MLILLPQLVTTRSSNARSQMQAAALKAAENYEKQALDRLRRIGLAAADLELKGGRKLGGGAFLPQHDLMVEETLG